MNKETMMQASDMLNSTKDIEGYPLGEKDNIISLSNPPFFTAFPNPFITDFISEFGKSYNELDDKYHKSPLVGDISEGKTGPIYNAHSYHTKVPHKAIMNFIQHYTDEGDIVLDAFCGSGMTGIAAQLLNRRAILSDLSPISSFIASNYNKSIDIESFKEDAMKILEEVENECGWMYETLVPDAVHQSGISTSSNEVFKGIINYIVWSDVFICPYCEDEYVFFKAAADLETGRVKKKYSCPKCHANIEKSECERAFDSIHDHILNETIHQAKQVPVLINYTFQNERYEKMPDTFDLQLIDKINKLDIPYWFPTERMIDGDEGRRNDRMGITNVHHFFTKRSLWVLSKVFSEIKKLKSKNSSVLIFTYEQAILGMSKIARYAPTHYSQVNRYLSGTLYIGSQIVEVSLRYIIGGKIKRLVNTFKHLNDFSPNNCYVSCQSTTNLSNIQSNSIDYIFTDPPFGGNLMYSDLNFLWECWQGVFTNNKSEAVISKTQGKKLNDYQKLMMTSFKEYYRVLKPKRWITVVFHNSKSSVWNAIQDAIFKAGFIIAQVSILDKKQGSFKQVTSTGAVKNDLVISAYKPQQSFEESFRKNTGQGLEEDFVEMHLNHLKPEPTIERTEQMLYSKMLAFYVQRNYSIKYDSKSFFQMLRNNFSEEDGFWFKNDQIESYREFKQKMKLETMDEVELGAFQLFVSDEKSAIIWLYAFLDEPKTFSEIQPAFTKVAFIGDDLVPELTIILDKNFVKDCDHYRRPASENEKLGVTEKREKELMKEFDILLLEAKGSNRKIKQCRKQAVLYGFEHCYKNNRLEDILILGKKLDKKILENSSELNDFIEIAEVNIEGF
jgi:DNA modification methylase